MSKYVIYSTHGRKIKIKTKREFSQEILKELCRVIDRIVSISGPMSHEMITKNVSSICKANGVYVLSNRDLDKWTIKIK